MRPATAATLLMLFATALVVLVLTGNVTNYVKPSMTPFLIITAAFCSFLGVWTLSRPPTRSQIADHRMLVPWLLLAPILTITVLSPPALGSYAASRDHAPVPAPKAGSEKYGPLPDATILPIPLQEYAVRSVHGGEQSLEGRRFSIVGFVTPDNDDENSWYVTRMRMSCCAADAAAIMIKVENADSPPTDQWVDVQGRYLPATTQGMPRLRAETTTPATKPLHP